MPESRYVTIPRAADYLDISERQLRRWVEQGLLTGLRIPGTKMVRIDLEEIDQVVTDHYFIRCSHPGCLATAVLPPLWGGTGTNVYFCPEHFDEAPASDHPGAAGNTANPVGSANTTAESPAETSEDLVTSPDRQES